MFDLFSAYNCTHKHVLHFRLHVFYIFSQTGSTPPYLLFSTRHEIQRLGVHTRGLNTLISGLPNTIALDYYYNHSSADGDGSLVFWTDVVDDKIYKGTLYGNGRF